MSKLLNIENSNRPNRQGDVVFVHGLDGDAIETWHPAGQPDKFWPAWVAKQFPLLGVWSLDYEAAALGWHGHAMPLDERATEVLSVLEAKELGKRPLIFITHSLGGLVVKRLLHNATDSANRDWQELVANTKGIVFLATPHTGADLGSWLSYIGKKLSLLRVNVAAEELAAHHPELRRLNTWFRDRVANGRLGLAVQVCYEKLPTHGAIVVDASSANPGIPGVEPIPQDADHITICKPESEDATLCRLVNKFLDQHFFV